MCSHVSVYQKINVLLNIYENVYHSIAKQHASVQHFQTRYPWKTGAIC